MRKIAVSSLLVMFVAIGCAQRASDFGGEQQAAAPGVRQGDSVVVPGYEGDAAGMPKKDMARGGAPGDPNARAAGAIPPILPSKIIYSGNVTVETKDFGKTEQALLQIVGKRGAVLASSSLSGTAPSRGATWTIRVASEQFQDMVRDMKAIGDLRSVNTTAQDVTEEFYDLESRIASKRVEEKRLMRHLVESTGNLRQILDVEHELARVTTELESMQGKLRLMGNQAAMSTLVVSAQEVIEYVPPAIAVVANPGFGARLGATLAVSLYSLGKTGEALLHVAVALAPWAIVFSLMMAAAWIAGRRALAIAARYAKAKGPEKGAGVQQASPSPAAS